MQLAISQLADGHSRGLEQHSSDLRASHSQEIATLEQTHAQTLDQLEQAHAAALDAVRTETQSTRFDDASLEEKSEFLGEMNREHRAQVSGGLTRGLIVIGVDY